MKDLRVPPCFQPECWKLRKATLVPTRVEPLEETPEETEGEIFHESVNLLSERSNYTQQLIVQNIG